jgi:ABC-type lipoprotein export system ATPase subunit
VIEGRGIRYRYPRGPAIFDGLDVKVEAGELVAITGVSGRGKSTLLYMLGLMLRPQAGEVLLDGCPVSQLKDAAISRLRADQFGFIFQDAALDTSRTVLDNVIEGALYRNQKRGAVLTEARGLLEVFGVQLRANAKPGQISGGQAQRIALCRALVGAPSIVLADEPTGNLDAEAATLVVETLKNLANTGTTVVIATHDHAVVHRCDREIQL